MSSSESIVVVEIEGECESRVVVESTTTEVHECIICHEEMKQEDQVWTLSCRHVYHHTCMTRWASTRGVVECPMCRSRSSTSWLLVLGIHAAEETKLVRSYIAIMGLLTLWHGVALYLIMAPNYPTMVFLLILLSWYATEGCAHLWSFLWNALIYRGLFGYDTLERMRAIVRLQCLYHKYAVILQLLLIIILRDSLSAAAFSFLIAYSVVRLCASTHFERKLRPQPQPQQI
jgi:hypothetical protein